MQTYRPLFKMYCQLQERELDSLIMRPITVPLNIHIPAEYHLIFRYL